MIANANASANVKHEYYGHAITRDEVTAWGHGKSKATGKAASLSDVDIKTKRK